MRAPPKCNIPVGLGAKRTRTALPFMPLVALQKADGLGGYPLAPAGKAEILRRRTAHAYPRGFYPQSFGQVSTHRLPMVPYLRTLANYHRVHVRDLPGPANYSTSLAQELHRIRVSIMLVGVGEVVANIFQAGRPEQSVGDGVGENVGIRVAERS